MFPLFSRQTLGCRPQPLVDPDPGLDCGRLRRRGGATDDLSDASLRPNAQTPIVVPADQPIVIGISAPLTGPDEAEGIEDRDAAIVGVERWKDKNVEPIKGHEIDVRAEDDGCTEADIAVQAAGADCARRASSGLSGPPAARAPKPPSPSMLRPASSPFRPRPLSLHWPPASRRDASSSAPLTATTWRASWPASSPAWRCRPRRPISSTTASSTARTWLTRPRGRCGTTTS